ncbi:MAG: PAS domain S-box protein [Gallionellaceae bacterium]|nr:PAS domain S-box protein [Gallionellaceae bacterium]
MEQPWNGIERRAQNQAGCCPAEAQMRGILQASPAGIGLTIDRVIQSVNPAMTALTGYSSEELIGQPTRLLYPGAAEYDHVGREKYAQIAQRGIGVVETRWQAKDGAILHILLSSVPIDPADLSRGVSFAALDITARKQLEQQRLADMEKQREVLVREVHHRIKNNLQSVVGLLRRELGKFLELDPHLDKAITQVHAIAVVHGLQSADPDEAIRLCDTVRHICLTVSEQTQRAVEFHIENEHASFQPVQINRDEAVAVALILNELILNAVKHSPEQAAAPQVSVGADGEHAHIVIRNTSAENEMFDLSTSADLRTGLRLVNSLLPERGAYLSVTRDAADLLTTHLRLEAPVVQAITRKGI